MLEDQVILDRKLQDSKARDNDSARNSESEHKVILNQTSPNMRQFFMRYRCGSPRALSRSVPQRHKNLFRYGINRPLNFDIGSRKSNYHHLANTSLDNDTFDATKSSRDLSRSAKIMRALSFDRNSFHRRNANIKRSLTFDLTPSPKRNGSSSSVGSSHTDSKISTPSPISDKILRLDTSSTDSSPNSILIASLDSIDENQNRTPQQSRKITKNNTDKSGSSNSTSSYSSLRNNLKERITDIVSTSKLRSLKRDNTPKAVNYDIATSTPRNLFQEFNEIDCDRSHTPENMIRLIPESMSAIKKSHKKERSYRHREQSAKQEDTSVRKEDSNTRTRMESLEIDSKSASNSCDMSSTSEKSTRHDQSQKRGTNVKKMLVYNSDNEISDTESFSALRDTIDSNDVYVTSQENLQDSDAISPSSSHYKYKDKEDNSNGNASKEEECQLLLQKESPNDDDNADAVEQRNRAVSLESNPTTLQNLNRVITPENYVNISEHMFTESIKKSHRKIKHENRKALFKSMILHRETTISKAEMLNQSIQSSNDNQYANIDNMSMNEMCDLSPQDPVRSHTPENVNSSRLLLSRFSSVKKSHRKNKTKEDNKRISSSRCHDGYHECRKRNVNLLQGTKYKEEDISEILCRDEPHQLKESSPNLSPIKKKKSMNAFLQSDTHELLNSLTTLSPEYENTNAEFRIYTPIRRRMSSVLTTKSVANYAYADVTSPEKDGSTQMASKKVDFSRCETPIARRFYRSDIESTRGKSCIHEEHANIDRSKNDVLITAHNEPENITHSENGRSTPLNMPTTELLCNINSIKKSHKKNKHDSIICKRRIFGKEQLYTEKTWNKNFASSVNMEKRTIPSLKLNLDGDIHDAEMGVCSNKRDDNNKDQKTINVYDDSQPCTSGRSDDTESKRNVQVSKLLSATPPNSRNTANFIKLLHTVSIKKSHKKERDRNAQAKYIFMSDEHDLSDDGSIFDEKDKLTPVESFDLCQDNDNEKIHS